MSPTFDTKQPLLRIYPSGSGGHHSSKWYGYRFAGVASGFVTSEGIPMLVAAALEKRKAQMNGLTERTHEQIFADSMDMELHRQAERAGARAKLKKDAHWKKVMDTICHARALVRQRMSETDRRNTE